MGERLPWPGPGLPKTPGTRTGHRLDAGMGSASPLPRLVGHGQDEIDGAIWDDASGVPMPCLCLPCRGRGRGRAIVQRPGRGRIKSCCTPSPVSLPSAHRQGPTRAPAEKCPKRTSKTGSVVVYFWPCPPGGDLHQRRVEPCEARFEPCLQA